MKNLQLLTFVLACSIGSVAVAKQGNMITIKNMNNQKYDRAVVKVWFIPFDNSGKTAQQGQKKQTHHVRTPRLGYLQLDMGSRKSATGNLYDATTHPCEYYVPGKRMAKKNIKNGYTKRADSCSETVLKKYFNDDPSNVMQILVDSINVGTFGGRIAMHATATKEHPSGGFARTENNMKGTTKRSFSVQGRHIEEDAK